MIPEHPSTLILQLSDLHLFRDPNHSLLGLNTDQSFETVLKKVRQLPTPPDVILLTGDLSQDESEFTYQHLAQKLSDFECPIYWVPGNHDNLQAMTRHLNQKPFCGDSSFQVGGWQVLLMDSTVDGMVHGELSPNALDQLDHDLKAIASSPTLIALHHPPFIIPSTWLNSGLVNHEALWQVLDRHSQVKVVLCGHIHQDFCFKRNGVSYLSAPSTCFQFAPNCNQFKVDDIDPGFRLIELTSTGDFQSWVERVSVPRQLDLATQGY